MGWERVTKGSTKKLRCDFCRAKGHIARFCLQINFRVSLTSASVKPIQPGEGHDAPDSPDAPEPPPEPAPMDVDLAVRLKERREVRRELRERAKEAKAAVDEEKDRRQRERKGLPHKVTGEEMKLTRKEQQLIV